MCFRGTFGSFWTSGKYRNAMAAVLTRRHKWSIKVLTALVLSKTTSGEGTLMGKGRPHVLQRCFWELLDFRQISQHHGRSIDQTAEVEHLVLMALVLSTTTSG